MSELAVIDYQPNALTLASDRMDVAMDRLLKWAEAAAVAEKVAELLVQTSFVPAAFRGKPQEATAAILAGAEVGLNPIASLRSFDIIQGVAAPRANTLRAILQSHGHDIWVVESTDTKCIVRGKRKGSDIVHESLWDESRARRMQLLGKDNWLKGQKGMLVARATSECCRLTASDAILGIPYSWEELFDEDLEPVAIPAADVDQPATRRVARRKPIAPAVAEPQIEAPTANTPLISDETVVDAVPVSSPPAAAVPPRTVPSEADQRLAEIQRLFDVAGIKGPQARREFCEKTLGRTVAALKDLSEDEAKRVTEELWVASQDPADEVQS